MNNDLEVTHPQSGSSSTWFLVELEFGNVDFWGEGKTECPEKNLSERRRKPTTNLTHIPIYGVDAGIWTRPHWWEASALAPSPSLAPQRDDERSPPPPPKRKEKPPATQADIAIKFPSTTRHSTTHVPQVDLRMKTQATLGCIRRFLT